MSMLNEAFLKKTFQNNSELHSTFINMILLILPES